MTPRHEALLLLGSNVAPNVWIPRGLLLVRARLTVRRVSSCFTSPAVGGEPGAPDFVNVAARVATR
ncbi:MAG: hypothetical protein ACC662_10010, partial [Planctomycetota bacterium]